MPVFALRLRDGNCLIIAAETQEAALARAHTFGRDSAIVSCREIKAFALEFTLQDEGDLKATLQDQETLADLFTNEYPMLGTALKQSYNDFNSSETDSRSEPVLYDDDARKHLAGWEKRDREIVTFSVLQERQRFSN
jgi:hypothetical protein